MFFIQIKSKKSALLLMTLFFSFYINGSSLPANQITMTFDNTIRIAQQNDPWLSGNEHEQRSIELKSASANTLPDPKVSIDFINNPTDGFDFNQEGMTQTKVGVAQVLPRGRSLKLKSQQLQAQSQGFPFQRRNRQAKVAVTVGKLWLDLYRIQNTIKLIEKHEPLFEQLISVSEKSYGSALTNSRQQDIVGAQIELTRLEDRLDQLVQHKQGYEGQLLQWLAYLPTGGSEAENLSVSSNQFHNMTLSENLPLVPLLNEAVVNDNDWAEPEQLTRHFERHPGVIAIDKKVNATVLGVELARQKYKPEWELKASYGHRRDDLLGRNRADLLSVGVSFDLPLFTENKQDKDVQSAIAYSESIKVEKHLVMREFLGSFSSAKGRLQRLKRRKLRYENQLLPQLREHAQTLLTAYTNESSSFSEVVKAHIAVLHAEIDQLTIQVEEQKLHLELNYLFVDGYTPNSVYVSDTISKKPNQVSTSGEL